MRSFSPIQAVTVQAAPPWPIGERLLHGTVVLQFNLRHAITIVIREHAVQPIETSILRRLPNCIIIETPLVQRIRRGDRNERKPYNSRPDPFFLTPFF